MSLSSIQKLDLRHNSRKKLILLGKTGHGKSALCNVLCQRLKRFNSGYKKIFPESASQEIGNTETILTDVNFLGQSDKEISLIDTVGFDNASINTSDIAELIFLLKECCDFINTFGVVVSAPKRIEASLRDTIQLFVDIFGKEPFWRNAVLIFTNLDQSTEQIEKRNKNSESDQNMINNFKTSLKKMFQIDVDLPAIILDAHYDGGKRRERSKFESDANILYKLLMNPIRKPCPVQDIKRIAGNNNGFTVQSLEDELKRCREKNEMLKKRAAEAKAETERERNKTIRLVSGAAVGILGTTAAVVGMATGKLPPAIGIPMLTTTAALVVQAWEAFTITGSEDQENKNEKSRKTK